MELDEDTIERIAARVAQLLSDRLPPAAPPPVRLVDAATLARMLDVQRSWVYRHARQLGAIRIAGPNGRLRFDLDVVLAPDADAAGSAVPTPRERPHETGLGFRGRSTYSRTGSTKSWPGGVGAPPARHRAKGPRDARRP